MVQRIIEMHMFVCLFVCLFVCTGVFNPLGNFFTHLETLPLPVKGYKF